MRQWRQKSFGRVMSHMKSAMLGPYASPGGRGFQATVSKQRGHWRLNPEDFSNRGVRENNAAIICRQVRSPGLSVLSVLLQTPQGPYSHSHRLRDTVTGGRTEQRHVCVILILSNNEVSARLRDCTGVSVTEEKRGIQFLWLP